MWVDLGLLPAGMHKPVEAATKKRKRFRRIGKKRMAELDSDEVCVLMGFSMQSDLEVCQLRARSFVSGWS